MYDHLTDRTADIAALADVERWNIIKTYRRQSVAEHSFMVATIVMEMCARLGMRKESDVAVVVTWSLLHDVPEGYTGDIDGKFKREHPGIKGALDFAETMAFPWWDQYRRAVPDLVKWIVKVADKIEALSFIQQHGYGTRAKDVESELLSILFNEVIPEAAKHIGVTEEHLVAVSRIILHHSLSEENNIQSRRHRGIKPDTSVPDSGYKPAQFVPQQHVPGKTPWNEELERDRMKLAEEGETD